MSRNDAVEAYLRGEITRRTFIRRLVAAGVGLSAAYAYSQLLTPDWARAHVVCDPYYEEYYYGCRPVDHQHYDNPADPAQNQDNQNQQNGQDQNQQNGQGQNQQNGQGQYQPPQDLTAPSTKVKVSKLSLASLLVTGRFVVRLASNEPGNAVVTATMRVPGKRKSAAKTVTVAKGATRFTKPGTRKVAVKLTRNGRKLLAKRRRGTVKVVARTTDAAGNSRVRKLALKLR